MTYHAETKRAFNAAAAMPPHRLRAIQGVISAALQFGDGLPEFRDRLQPVLDATTVGPVLTSSVIQECLLPKDASE